MVWHFCQAQDVEKLELLEKPILKYILTDWNCDYDSLQEQADTPSLANVRELAI